MPESSVLQLKLSLRAVYNRHSHVGMPSSLSRVISKNNVLQVSFDACPSSSLAVYNYKLTIRNPGCSDCSGCSCRPGFPSPLFPSLTCRQDQFIAVLGANWCSHSMWEQHTVVYPIGTNLRRVPIDDHTIIIIIVYSIPVKCPKSKALQGQRSSAVYFGIVISC